MVRDPARTAGRPAPGCGPRARSLPVRDDPRAENRFPEAIREWVGLLRAVASPDRPVVLALHPGTRAALEASGATLGDDVIVVEPLGYRSSLTLQPHAAAVLTDSGGFQREASWLGVPCLVLRSTTEWPELVAASGGRMSLVALDADRARHELRRWAPPAAGPSLAAARARDLAIPDAGAAAAITARWRPPGCLPTTDDPRLTGDQSGIQGIPGNVVPEWCVRAP